ncbi:type 4a pilus biogenesis protein PilO [Agaribacterium sp. ZY112]|uniref:type 4a pilus biogenesis protein PilO n=1 Tax=Agaribacterium sp. ZY112 TaxID=3233574 RepID=UPI0035268B43
MTDVAKFIEQLQEFDVNDLDFNRVGVWPLAGRIFLCVLASLALVSACYFLVVKDKQLRLETVSSQERGLRSDFEAKAHEAVNLDTYRAQMVKMEEGFGALIARLPTKTEVPGLLEDIDDKGVESRLEINRIALQEEVVSDIHVELPIRIEVEGGFHEFGAFVSGIAGMPRIVTLHDFLIEPATKDKAGLLKMQLQAKTYRYKGEE